MKHTAKSIEKICNDWIRSLYRKDGKVSKRKAKPFWYEPINWGDLKVVEVNKHGPSWFVETEEASPGCWRFAAALSRHLKTKGITALVYTEW